MFGAVGDGEPTMSKELQSFDFSYEKGEVWIRFKDEKGQESTINGNIFAFKTLEVHKEADKWSFGYAWRLPE